MDGSEHHRGFSDHFSDHARSYSESRPHYTAAIFDYLASLVPSLEMAWDCGTGNGQAALSLVERFRRVVATDASDEQIHHAFTHPRIDYRVEPAESTSIEPRSVDLITVGTAVHWFDFDRFWKEARRVARPGGVLAVWTYHFPAPLGPELDRILERYYHETLRGFWPEEIHYLEDHYHTLPFPFDEIEAPEFFMEAEWRLDDMIGFLSSWSASSRYREHHGREPTDEVADDIRAAWGETDDVRRIVWPLHCRIGWVGD